MSNDVELTDELLAAFTKGFLRALAEDAFYFGKYRPGVVEKAGGFAQFMENAGRDAGERIVTICGDDDVE